MPLNYISFNFEFQLHFEKSNALRYSQQHMWHATCVRFSIDERAGGGDPPVPVRQGFKSTLGGWDQNQLEEGNVRCWFSLLGGFRGSMDRVPSHLIVAFDLGTQEFHEVSLPDELSSLGGVNVLDLSVLGRDLCVAHYDKNRCLDLWTMKDRKVKASWSKLLSIIVEKGLWCPRPLAYSKYGDKILMEDEMNTLFWYDLVKEEVEKVDNIPNGMHVFSTEICVESLVELEAYRGIRGRKIGL
ncbi:F-box protein CPR1-like [Tripterygium wilfordii]|uniref:F-box protein CPR1-like n=1 Tax=Tripterygium wilfordii TaxID=458696 RepID=UPI0018F81821|nr:F-box protein CPR1-like [Tripterygium wilfordii]